MKYRQSRFFCSISLIIFSLVFFCSAHAADIGKFYEASVKVEAGKSENDLIAEAFTRVLVKVSGRSDIASSPAYMGMVEKARGAISQFRYDHKVIATDVMPGTETVKTEDKEEQKEKWFWVRFNIRTVDSLLKQAQIPIWGKIRPETLIWFSQEVKGKRYLQNQHDVPEIYDVFKERANDRGISLIFPFLDLQDQSSISTTDIWGNFHDSVLLASKRYQAPITVTVRMFKKRSGLWIGQWNLLMLGEVQSWELQDEKQERILSSGIDELADRLALQFTQKASKGDDSGILIQVNNVSGFGAFQTLDDYFNNLATVKSAALVQMKKDQVIYNINYLGDKNALIQEISLGDVLNSVERTQVNYGDGNDTKEFQPVILDGLDKKETSQMSDREKALRAMEQSTTTKGQTQTDTQRNNAQQGTASTQTNSQTNTQTMTPDAQVPEKIIEPLIPELEYWLVR